MKQELADIVAEAAAAKRLDLSFACNPEFILRLAEYVRGLERDAERYRWLRVQHWNDSALCVVADPKNAVKLGHDCPSNQRLDEIIDTAIAKEQP